MPALVFIGRQSPAASQAGASRVEVCPSAAKEALLPAGPNSGFSIFIPHIFCCCKRWSRRSFSQRSSRRLRARVGLPFSSSTGSSWMPGDPAEIGAHDIGEHLIPHRGDLPLRQARRLTPRQKPMGDGLQENAVYRRPIFSAKGATGWAVRSIPQSGRSLPAALPRATPAQQGTDAGCRGRLRCCLHRGAALSTPMSANRRG